MKIEELHLALLNDMVLVYSPKGTQYTITGLTKVKNDDGSWSMGVNFTCPQGVNYTRRLNQLDKFSLEVRS